MPLLVERMQPRGLVIPSPRLGVPLHRHVGNICYIRYLPVGGFDKDVFILAVIRLISELTKNGGQFVGIDPPLGEFSVSWCGGIGGSLVGGRKLLVLEKCVEHLLVGKFGALHKTPHLGKQEPDFLGRNYNVGWDINPSGYIREFIVGYSACNYDKTTVFIEKQQSCHLASVGGHGRNMQQSRAYVSNLKGPVSVVYNYRMEITADGRFYSYTYFFHFSAHSENFIE